MPNYACQSCGRAFTVPEATLLKYPSWRPKQCRACYAKRSGTELRGTELRGTELRGTEPRGTEPRGTEPRGTATPPFDAAPERPRTSGGARVARAVEADLSPAEVLATYTAGPDSGVFTDGAAHPNPGAGGWGAVYVVNSEIKKEASGHEPQTTNNRMELFALIAGYGLVPAGESATVYTDSRLCVNTINVWAAEWRKNGWKRKGGAIKNLDLVERLYDLARARPEIELRWIKAHNGYRWNEYADALATAYRRP